MLVSQAAPSAPNPELARCVRALHGFKSGPAAWPPE